MTRIITTPNNWDELNPLNIRMKKHSESTPPPHTKPSKNPVDQSELIARLQRELEIEASLERVRSASMAMHKSEELKEVASAVFRQLKELNIEMDTASILILSEHNADFNVWIGMESNKDYSTTSIHVPEFDDYLFPEYNSEIKNRTPLTTKSYTYEEKISSGIIFLNILILKQFRMKEKNLFWILNHIPFQ